MVQRGELLEYAEFAGHFYGTPAPGRRGAARGRYARSARDRAARRPAGTRLGRGRPAGLPGAALVGGAGRVGWSAAAPRPPTSSPRRLATAQVELAAQSEFDAVVVNDEVGLAAARLVALPIGLPRTRPRALRSQPEGLRVSGTVAAPEGITNPPIDELLAKRRLQVQRSSSTRPSARARSTPTTASSARACSSTSARSSRRTSRRSRSRSRMREINAGLLTPSPSSPTGRSEPVTGCDVRAGRSRRSFSGSAAASRRTRPARSCAG